MTLNDHFSAPLSQLDKQMVRSIPEGGNWKNIPPQIPSKRLDQIRQSAAQGEGSRSTYYGRLSWDKPAYTISTYFNRPGNGCFIHPSADRLITVREAARLQSFPDHYRFSGSLRQRCVQVGNAVPPLLAYQIARCLPRGPVVDLFAGAGGMSLGFEWAGHRTVAALDHDKAAIETLRSNRPGFDGAVLCDLASSDSEAKSLERVRSLLAGRHLVGLVGGPPCQGFSSAGNCLADDPRNKLVSVLLEWTAHFNPHFVLLENVPAIMWRRHKGVLPQIHSEFSRLGYHSASVVAHAEAYGVPQLRRRVFVLAFRDPLLVAWPAPVFSVLAPAFPRFQPGMGLTANERRPVTVREAIGDLPLSDAPTLGDEVCYLSKALTDYQKWARGLVAVDDWVPQPAKVSAQPYIAPSLLGPT